MKDIVPTVGKPLAEDKEGVERGCERPREGGAPDEKSKGALPFFIARNAERQLQEKDIHIEQKQLRVQKEPQIQVFGISSLACSIFFAPEQGFSLLASLAQWDRSEIVNP